MRQDHEYLAESLFIISNGIKRLDLFSVLLSFSACVLSGFIVR